MGMNTLRNYRWSQSAQQRLRAWRPGGPAAGGQRGPREPAEPAGPRDLGEPSFGPREPPGHRERDAQAAIYWRRRLVALVIGLAVLALIAWAFAGAIGGGSSPAAQGHSGSGHSGSGHPGGGQGAAAVPAGAGAAAGARQPRNAAATSGRSRNAPAASQPAPCYRGDVVLSLFSSQNSYGSGGLPQFNVDVVTTGRQTCTFNVGAMHVALVIRSGVTRVWSSADCVQGAGNLVSDLQRGVPTVVPISWNLKASSPGCPAASSKMPAGTYTAVVTDGALESNIVTFRTG